MRSSSFLLLSLALTLVLSCVFAAREHPCDKFILDDPDYNPIGDAILESEYVVKAILKSNTTYDSNGMALLTFEVTNIYKDQRRSDFDLHEGMSIIVEVKNDNVSQWRTKTNDIGESFVLFLEDRFEDITVFANVSLDACDPSIQISLVEVEGKPSLEHWLNDCVWGWIKNGATGEFAPCPCIEETQGEKVEHFAGNYTMVHCNNKCQCFINGYQDCEANECGLTEEERKVRRAIALAIVIVLGIFFVVAVTIHQVRAHRRKVRHATAAQPSSPDSPHSTVQLEDH